MTKVYAIYTNYYPTWKYEPQLESIYSNLERAKEAATNYDEDFVWIEELIIDSDSLYNDTCKAHSIKGGNK
jgi:hypothetical protein